MSVKKLNDLEMSSIRGGELDQIGQVACSATCSCYKGQTEAKHAFAENMLEYDSKFQ